MKRRQKIAAATVGAFINSYLYTMFLYWVGGGEFIRGESLKWAFVAASFLAALAACLAAAVAYDFTEPDKEGS